MTPSGSVSDEDRDALRQRVSLVGARIIAFREVPTMSFDTITVMWGRLHELAAELPYWFFLLDLSAVGSNRPPNPELRAALLAQYRKAPPEHVAVFSGKNHLLDVAAKFILRSILGRRQVTVHRTLDHGLQHLEDLDRERSQAVGRVASTELDGG